ncbi:MAG: UDP-3-O-acyl-N-acetylglucosamine deacetylase [Leptospiraceae bacterium]|nr:MAG: UDP-3-O-acyl-N-acetylglucosamine deacetylase [Leptospiraceae bacterium]
MMQLLEKQTIQNKEHYAKNYIGRYYRATIQNEIHLKGIGLHTGLDTNIYLIPAKENTGIIFRNFHTKEEIKADPFHVKSTVNAVTLSNGNWEVHTVEHLMCALATAGITDIIIELDREEVPILDGSSKEFYDAIQEAKVIESIIPLEPIKIINPVWVVSQDKYMIAVPSDEFKVTYTIHYDHPDLRGRSLHISLNSQVVEKEILQARTFGFLKDVEYLRSKGLIKGASIDNAVVLTEDGYLNSNLRYPDECIRHKVLDLIGDLYLLNRPIIAHIIAFRTGHTMDIALAKNILNHIENNQFLKKK